MERREVKDEIYLIEQAVKGDNEAFSAVFDQYHEQVFTYVMRLANDPDLAEDITQETFIRAHRNLDRFGFPWRMRPWLCQIARNVFLQHLQGVSPQEILDSELAFTGPGPEQLVIAVETSELIQYTLSRLEPRYREALTLRELDGFPYSEIAEIMGIRIDNVRVLLHRARSRFRDLYAAHRLAADTDGSCHQDHYAQDKKLFIYSARSRHHRDAHQINLCPPP